MKRLVVSGVAVGLAAMALAMPTKKELQTAQPIVTDVMSADMKALKAGVKKPAEVAAHHEELAEKASSEAGKFLLLQGAFKLYAKASDYEAAANVIERLQTEIPEFNPEVTVELCGAEFIRKMRENAPRLYALKENARRIVFYRKQLPIREAALKKNPKDLVAVKKLGECHAELGDWAKALDVFATGADKLGKVASGEKSGKLAPQDAADFWWDYETKSETPVYKLHAAELYRTALASDDFKGLVRERAELRMKSVESLAVAQPVVSAAVSAKPVKLEKKILDLSCKRKLELIPCPAGTFTMGETDTPKGADVRKHKVKITRPFWLSTVAVTHEQWEWVLNRAVYDKPDADVPKTNTHINRKKGFLDALNTAFAAELPEGYVFRLPTEAEYVYAMTSGGKDKITELSIGVLGPSRAEKEANAKVFGWNRDGTTGIRPTTVGLKKPNTWGFYDVINNGDPIVLDAMALGVPPRKLEMGEKDSVKSISYDDIEVDPLQYDSEGKLLYMSLPQTSLGWRKPIGTWDWIGVFRVCLGPDLVAEKKAARDKVTSASLPVKGKGGERVKIPLNARGRLVLEMSTCPPGEFVMGNHKVKLSYPYLIGCGHVTFGMVQVMDEKIYKARMDEIGADEKKFHSADMSFDGMTDSGMEELLKKLNSLAGKVPELKAYKGYEFRLPTEAEWMWAYRAGMNNETMEYIGDDELKEYWQKRGNENWKAMPADQDVLTILGKKPNSWGVHSMVRGRDELADTFAQPLTKEGKPTSDLGKMDRDVFAYASEEEDPIHLCADSNACRLTLKYQNRYPEKRLHALKDKGTRIRVVYGPKIGNLNAYPKTAAKK